MLVHEPVRHQARPGNSQGVTGDGASSVPVLRRLANDCWRGAHGRISARNRKDGKDGRESPGLSLAMALKRRWLDRAYRGTIPKEI